MSGFKQNIIKMANTKYSWSRSLPRVKQFLEPYMLWRDSSFTQNSARLANCRGNNITTSNPSCLEVLRQIKNQVITILTQSEEFSRVLQVIQGVCSVLSALFPIPNNFVNQDFFLQATWEICRYLGILLELIKI